MPLTWLYTTAAELLGALVAPTRRERARYRTAQFAHGPRWVEHTTDGERWFGFAAAKELTTIAPGIVLVSVPGHSRGHACIAVQAGQQWLLHAGDSFYHWGALGDSSKVPFRVRVMDRVATDFALLVENQERLAELHRSEDNVRVVSAHDPADLDGFVHRSAPSTVAA